MLEYVGTLRVPIGSTPARVAEGVRDMNLPGIRCVHAAVVVAHRYQSCGFVTFLYGSVSANPYLMDPHMDPTPDPAVFVNDLHDGN
jgi:hypothetical protein